MVESWWLKTNRYPPPTRTSISQESRVRPYDLGTHHLLNRSALVQASNTRRAGALTVRVTTSSSSDFRSTRVWFFVGVVSLSLLASIFVLLLFQFLNNNVQLVEARGPELAIPLDPCRFFFQSAQPQPAGPHAPNLLRADESRLLEDAYMFLHARKGHVEPFGQGCDGSVGTPE